MSECVACGCTVPLAAGVALTLLFFFAAAIALCVKELWVGGLVG